MGQVFGGEGGPGREAGQPVQELFQRVLTDWARRLKQDTATPEAHEHELLAVEGHPGQAPPPFLLGQAFQVIPELGDGVFPGPRAGEDARALELDDEAVEHGVRDLPLGHHELVAHLLGYLDLLAELGEDRFHAKAEGGLVGVFREQLFE